MLDMTVGQDWGAQPNWRVSDKHCFSLCGWSIVPLELRSPQDVGVQFTVAELHISCQYLNFSSFVDMICISQTFGHIRNFTSIAGS